MSYSKTRMPTYDEYCVLCNEVIALAYQKQPQIELSEMLNPNELYQITILWQNSIYSMINNVFYNYTIGQITGEYFDKFLADLKIKLS